MPIRGCPLPTRSRVPFTLATDFAGGGISNVPGILMKQAETTPGGGRSPVSLSRSSPAVSTIVDHGISKLISRHAKLKLYRYEVLTYLCIWTYLLLERRGANQEGQIMQESPAPWCVEKIAGGFRVRDGNGRPIVWVYGQENPIRPDVMTLGEAKAMALRIAMLAELRRESEDFHVQAASLQQAAA